MLGRHIGRTDDPIGRFDHVAIDTQIVGTILRIASHTDAGSDKGGGIESRRRDQTREAFNAVAKPRAKRFGGLYRFSHLTGFAKHPYIARASMDGHGTGADCRPIPNGLRDSVS